MTLLEKFEEYDSLATSIWDSDQTKAFFEFREPLIAALTEADETRTALLAALQEFIGWWDSGVCAAKSEMILQCRAAIAKATGEAS